MAEKLAKLLISQAIGILVVQDEQLNFQMARDLASLEEACGDSAEVALSIGPL